MYQHYFIYGAKICYKQNLNNGEIWGLVTFSHKKVTWCGIHQILIMGYLHYTKNKDQVVFSRGRVQFRGYNNLKEREVEAIRGTKWYMNDVVPQEWY